MENGRITLLTGEVLEENVEMSLAEFCRASRLPAEDIFRLVEEGIVEPLGSDPAHWRFRGIGLRRAQCAVRLRQDLGVNLAGAALALDLLDELSLLRARLRRLDG